MFTVCKGLPSLPYLITEHFAVPCTFEVQVKAWHVLYYLSLEGGVTNHTTVIEQSWGNQLGVLISNPALFPFYFVASPGGLFTMVEKYRSPLCANIRNSTTFLPSLD